MPTWMTTELGWDCESNKEKKMDTLFIVTQMVMTVAMCLLLYFSISNWILLRNKPKREKPTKVILLEQEKKTRKKRID